MPENQKPLKLYDKVKDIIKEQIVSGTYRPADLLPCSDELSSKYNVSLITIRRALTELQREGLILLHQGRRAEVAECRRTKPKVFIRNKSRINILITAISSNEKINYKTGPWTYTIFSGIQSELLDSGVAFTFIPFGDPGEVTDIIKGNSAPFDGIIMFATNLWKTIDDLIPEIKKPYCLVCGQTAFNSVSPDYYNGSGQIAEYFMEHKLKNFIFLKNSLSGVCLQKMRGFQEMLLFKGISPERIHIVNAEDATEESAEKAIFDFLNLRKNIAPVGIFTNGDGLACGAVNASKKKGMRLIQDYMVVGGTGLKEAEFYSPKLSVQADPMFQTGEEASRMILRMIKNKSLREPSVILPINLVHRETTIP